MGRKRYTRLPKTLFRSKNFSYHFCKLPAFYGMCLTLIIGYHSGRIRHIGGNDSQNLFFMIFQRKTFIHTIWTIRYWSIYLYLYLYLYCTLYFVPEILTQVQQKYIEVQKWHKTHVLRLVFQISSGKLFFRSDLSRLIWIFWFSKTLFKNLFSVELKTHRFFI